MKISSRCHEEVLGDINNHSFWDVLMDKALIEWLWENRRQHCNNSFEERYCKEDIRYVLVDGMGSEVKKGVFSLFVLNMK